MNRWQAAVSIPALLMMAVSVPASELRIQVKAGEHAREPGIPLIAELPVGLKEAGSAALIARSGGEEIRVPAQVIPGGRTRLIWMLESPLGKGETRLYTVDLRTREEPESGETALAGQMHCLDTGSVIELISGREPILQYNKHPTPAAEENEPFYSRTGYIHPLFTPLGKTITGDYAADHPHQHGLFFAWTNTTFEGRKINFWDQKSQKARVLHQSTVKTLSGPVFAQFVVMHGHEDLTAPDGPKPVLNERWMVRAYRTGGDFFIVDIQSTQTCASRSPLVINQYHYGGMAIRGNDDWFVNEKDARQPSDFLTNEGKTRADGNHSKPNWVDLHGDYADGSKAGVAIFDHPDNFRFPQPVRLHPSKPYFVFTPQVESGFEIKPGEPYLSSYRYVIHDGDPDPDFLNRLWIDYADPPRVTFVKSP